MYLLHDCKINPKKKWGEISKALKRRCVDICCLQEVRWTEQGAKMTGSNFNFFWSRRCIAKNGMGVIVASWLIGKVLRAERFNDRVKKVKIKIGDFVCRVVSCYCPQTGRSVN